MNSHYSEAGIDLIASARRKRFGIILADPPWQLQNRTGKVAQASAAVALQHDGAGRISRRADDGW